jgi:predicted aldo/keto reductase-like oxidoreductase
LEKIRLGKTGMMVTRIGFGGIPIQRDTEEDAVKVVQRCLEHGINFLDTANSYSTSEGRIGKAIKGRRREEIYIATKSGGRTREDIEKHLDLSLKRLDVDYIDLYQFHQVGDMPTMEKVLDPENGLLHVFEGFKKAGKIRHIGVTSHRLDVAQALVRSEKFETIMFPFNFVTSEPAEELLPLCREHDVGFINMKSMGGGMLEDPVIAFKYLFQFKDIVIIPGIEKPGDIDEIVKIYHGTHQMTAAERDRMQRLKDELGTRFCRRCDYCQPCTQEIPISMVMTFPSFVKRMPPGWYLKSPFIPAGMARAAECSECGECETRCPYGLPIREMIAAHYKMFEEIRKRYQE